MNQPATIPPTRVDQVPRQAPDESTSSGTRRTPRRALVVVAVAVALFTLLTAGASPANASMYIGGTPTGGVPGIVDPIVSCTLGRITVKPLASVQSAYKNGQYISYRYYVESNRGHRGYSGWSGAQLVPTNNYNLGWLPQSSMNASINTTWWVQIQIARWHLQGSSWSVTYENFVPARYVTPAGNFTPGDYPSPGCYT